MPIDDGNERLEGFKSIADYISRKTGRAFGFDAVRKASRRPVCPLPVSELNGRYESTKPLIDEWISFMTNRRLRGSRKVALTLVAA